MRSSTRTVLALVLGVLLGVAVTVAAYVVTNRTSNVFVLKETIRLHDGIVLPKGTQFAHHSSMSEGFETLKLFVNISTADAPQLFDTRIETKSELVIPYWIRR